MYAQTPLVIGESDPEGCAACGVSNYPQNGYRNGTMFPTYTALQIARTYELADLHQVNLLGAVTVGVPLRRPAVFRRFPQSGDQRDQQAGPEHVPDARADERRSCAGHQLGRPHEWKKSVTRVCAARPISRRSRRGRRERPRS